MAEEVVKVGLISCAGEDLPEGTISRLAVRRVMEHLRPGQAVTICLPLFLAGNEGERDFARNFPTITIDGCEKRCAQWGTEKYSGPVSAAFVVTDLLKNAAPLSGERSGRELTEADLRAVHLVAERLAEALDQAAGTQVADPSATAETSPTCGCATGIPSGTLQIDGHAVRIAGLPLLFQQCRTDGLAPDAPDLGRRLMEVVQVYHPIPTGQESAYQEALCTAYRGGMGSVPASDSKGVHSR